MTECKYLTHGNLCMLEGECEFKDAFINYVKIQKGYVYGVCDDAPAFVW